MLADRGILPVTDLDTILEALDKIQEELEGGTGRMPTYRCWLTGAFSL